MERKLAKKFRFSSTPYQNTSRKLIAWRGPKSNDALLAEQDAAEHPAAPQGVGMTLLTRTLNPVATQRSR